jgi:hypothetical protein
MVMGNRSERFESRPALHGCGSLHPLTTPAIVVSQMAQFRAETRAKRPQNSARTRILAEHAPCMQSS